MMAKNEIWISNVEYDHLLHILELEFGPRMIDMIGTADQNGLFQVISIHFYSSLS